MTALQEIDAAVPWLRRAGCDPATGYWLTRDQRGLDCSPLTASRNCAAKPCAAPWNPNCGDPAAG
ncbi:MAG: hypothetical protein IPK83_24965 [Planctomycetes bacterium]|nr:hypothetical protein [Planctomycetota bacterium]